MDKMDIERKGFCMPIFVVALPTIAKLRDQHRYPSTDEWKCVMHKQWNISDP
jgi:hypothetical protein